MCTLARTLYCTTLLLSPLASAVDALGQGTNVDWNPTAKEVILNTDFARIQTSAGPINVANGVFVFRNVTIPRGTRVRGAGSKPLIFVLAGTFRVDGEVSVRGGDGQRVNTLRSANFPSPGGAGVCTGGNGGRGSPRSAARSSRGERGFGPLQIPGFGGRGGRIVCPGGRGIGSGGGGGTFATIGDPWFKAKARPGNVFVQQKGQGGYGSLTGVPRQLAGGVPGDAYFRDNNAGNNFIGYGIDVNRRRLIVGELPLLVGGSGGGGGGDYGLACAVNDPNFANDEKGGGGGGGGGVVIVIAEGSIVLGPTGRIQADGGNGGGGAWAGSSNRAGGGGGGAGGLVVLYTKKQIDIRVHGETYAKNDFDFPVSADGGVGRLSPFGGGGNVVSKYLPAPNAGSWRNMDARPAGGMGGMGLIQLMAPPGVNRDGTNTLLDDNVVLRGRNGVLTGAIKQRYLAWRGFPDAQGVWRDDRGVATNIGDKDGDFRPTPILLPVF